MQKWNLRLVYAMVVVDTAIQAIAIPIFPEFVKDVPNGNFWFGFSIALFRFMQLISGPVFGWIADKYSRKVVFVSAAIGTFIANIVALPIKLPFLLANRTIDGSMNGFYVAVRSSITDMSNKSNLNTRLGLLGATGAIGIIVGPAMGTLLIFSGLLNNYIDQNRQLFALALLLGLVNIIMALSFKETNPKKALAGSEEKLLDSDPVIDGGLPVTEKIEYKNLISDFKDLWKNNRVLAKLGVMELLITLVLGYYSYFIIYVQNVFGFEPVDTAIFMMFAGIMIALSQSVFFLYLIKKVNVKKSLIFCSTAGIILMIAYGSVNQIWMLYALVFLDIVSVTPISGLIQGQIGHLSPENKRGRVVGLIQGFAGIIAFTNPLIFGILSEFSIQLPFFWFALGSFGLLIIALGLPNFADINKDN